MKDHSIQAQAERTNGTASSQSTAVGPEATFAAHPGYGIDFLDGQEAGKLRNRDMGARILNRTAVALQAKLTIGEPVDAYEQEADRIADQVMAGPSDSAVSATPPRIQRLSAQRARQPNEAPASVDQVLSSPGRPMEPSLRQDMEQRFGRDFSRVRVHTGAAAEQSARDVNAHAYTLGHDIVLAAGQFAPGTAEGRRLLAHELTHVVQQSAVANGAVSGLIQRQPVEAPLKRKQSRRQRTEEERLSPVRLDAETLPQAVENFVPRILSAINGARYKPVKGVSHAHGATPEEALWEGTVSVAKLIARDAIYYFSGNATLLEVESNLSQPVDPANPDELPAPKSPLPPEGLVLVAEPATKRKWQMFQQRTGRYEMLPFAGELSLPEGMGAGQLLVFIYAPGHIAADDGGPQPGYKAKGVKDKVTEDYGWAQNQYSRVMRVLEGRAKPEKTAAKAPAGTGTGRAGEGPGGGGRDLLGHGTGGSGTGSGAAMTVGGTGRGGEARHRDRAKPDKVAYYIGKRGPTLNVWKGGSHEAILLKSGEGDEDLIRRIEEAAARQQSTGQRIADGATVTGFAGGQGGRRVTYEEIAEATKFTANAPAYPSRMEMQDGSGAEVSPNGWGTTISGARNKFDMILDWDALNFGLANQVLARLGWVDYYWQVIDISKLDLGGESRAQEAFEQEDDFRQRLRKYARRGAQDSTNIREVTELEGGVDKVLDVVSHKWEEAKKDAPDIVAADTLVTWPVKAAQISSMAVDTAWSVGKALIDAWVTKATEPENRREINLGQPGEFLIRCLANPQTNEDKPYDQRTRRETSIAVFPVRVVDASSRAQEVAREDKSQLERVQMLVAALQKELAADPNNEWLQNRLECAQFTLDQHQASYRWSAVEKVGHELESYDKQISVLEKLKVRGSSIADLKGEEKLIAFDLKEEISERLKRGPNGFVAWYDYEFHLHDVKEARKRKAEQKKLTEKKAEALKPETAVRPRVTFVSEENGALVRMEMILGRAKGSSDQKPKWILSDVTTPDTARSYEGSASKAGAEGDVEAVTKAFEAFAEKAEYGRGTISIEIPERKDLMASGMTMLMKPGAAARWRGRLRSLIEVAGLVAPFVKGGQLIGQIAAIGSALDASEKLYDRAVNDRLKANFETLADVVTVLTPVASGAAALSTRLSPSGSPGAYILRIGGKSIDYANDLILPATFVHDLDQLLRDTSLGGPEKKAAIVMLFGRAMRDGVVQYASKVKGIHHLYEPAGRVGAHEPATAVAGHTVGTSVGEAARPAVERIAPVEGGAAPAREPTASEVGVHEKFDLSDVKEPAETAALEIWPRPIEARQPPPAETNRPPEPPPDIGVRPRDVDTIEKETRPDARARARAADFTPMFAQWKALGVEGRRARIESLINAHLAREGIPPIRVKLGDKPPGSAEFNSSFWLIVLSKDAVSADGIGEREFATLVGNAVHEGRHAVTTFRGLRAALADKNFKQGTVILDSIVAEADKANDRKPLSAELSAEALGEAREIYEVVFAQDLRRITLGTVGVIDREAVITRMQTTAKQASDARALYNSSVEKVERLAAEDKHGSAEYAQAQRTVADALQVWRRADRDAVAAHNEYVALPEETDSWRMGSAVQAAVLERLALETRLTDLRRQRNQVSAEQRRKRKSGDRQGAAEALKKNRETESQIEKAKAGLDKLVSKKPQLVGGRIARQNQPLTKDEIKSAPKARPIIDDVNPATGGNAAVPPSFSTPKTPPPPESDVGAPASAAPNPSDTTQQTKDSSQGEFSEEEFTKPYGEIVPRTPGQKPESTTPALSSLQESARQEWEQVLLQALQKGEKKDAAHLRTISGVTFFSSTVTRDGGELKMSYLAIRNAAGPRGAGIEVHDALEQALFHVAQQTGAELVRITVDQVGNEYLRKALGARGYHEAEESKHLPEDQRAWVKITPVAPSSPGTDIPPAASTTSSPPSGTPTPVAAPEGHDNEPTRPDIRPLPPEADNEPTHTDIQPPEAEPTAPHIQELPEVGDTLVDLPLGEIDDNDVTQVEIELPMRHTIQHPAPPPPHHRTSHHPAPLPARYTIQHPAPPPPHRHTIQHPAPPPARHTIQHSAPPPARRTVQHPAPPPPLPRVVAEWDRDLPGVARRIEALRARYQRLAPSLINNYREWLAIRASLDPNLKNVPVWTEDMQGLDHEFFEITRALAEMYGIPFDDAWNQLAIVLGFDPEQWSNGNPE